MFDLLASGVANEWLQTNQILPAKYDPVPLVSTWQGLPLLNPPLTSDPQLQQTIEQYLTTLKGLGLNPQQQGIWIQTDSAQLINHQAGIPLPAASLTKSATTLAALKTWGFDKRFDTNIAMTGSIQGDTLVGDLIIEGASDPLFVWEDAQALAQTLNKMGIQQVSGNLQIVGDFAMNYQRNPQKAGELLKQGLSGATLAQSLSPEQLKDVNVIQAQSAKLANSGKFQVKIAGAVLVVSAGIGETPLSTQAQPGGQKTIIRHRSLPLLDIIREMNIYSNNEIAQTLAEGVGGPAKVMEIAAATAGFPASEIQLVNGSGLGVQNQIAPHAVSQIFRAIHRLARQQQLTVADLFPASGTDRKGSMLDRKMPVGTTVKTGTLNEVSALTGALPTRDRGLVWFTIINRGTKIVALRQQQDLLLQSLLTRWGQPTDTPWGIARHHTTPPYLGDPERNEIVLSPKSSPK
jgi:serine-type D-Ala-D-Ala carboxypeptidase/endopeptidase (penicillin-binding protein 4)